MLGGLHWRAACRRRSSAARQHVHFGNARQALCGLLIAYPGCLRWAEPGAAAECWPCISGGLDAARPCRRGAFRGACSHLGWWWMERAVACACGSASCGRRQELHDADLSVWGQNPTNTHLRSGVGSHETTCERHGANTGRHVTDFKMSREQTCDWRAVRKSIVAATGPMVYATRLTRGAKISRRCYQACGASEAILIRARCRRKKAFNNQIT